MKATHGRICGGFGGNINRTQTGIAAVCEGDDWREMVESSFAAEVVSAEVDVKQVGGEWQSLRAIDN